MKALLDQMMEVLASPKPVTELWWNALQPYNMEDIEKACTIHLTTETFAPTIAQLIKLITKHPTAEEAWNAIPKNEETGGMVSTEMMAAYIACEDSMLRNDMIAARMAFLEAYKRAVAQSIAQRNEPNFTYSAPNLGPPDHRARQKQNAIESAKALGWITNDRAQLMLEHTEQQDFSVQRLEYEGTQGSSEVKTEALKEIRNTLKGFKSAN